MNTHPLDVLAKGLAEAGAEDLELDVRVGAAVLKVHRPRQTCDVALKEGRERGVRFGWRHFCFNSCLHLTACYHQCERGPAWNAAKVSEVTERMLGHGEAEEQRPPSV